MDTDTPDGAEADGRAKALGLRLHDFYCRAQCIPSTPPEGTAIVPEGWRFTWKCGYTVSVTKNEAGLDALEGYWRRA